MGSAPTEKAAPAYFRSHAYDQAAAGIGAGVVATVCMNPLDLIKVKFQVNTAPVRPLFRSAPQSSAPLTARIRNTAYDVVTGGRVGRDMAQSLRKIVREQGVQGLYRGMCTNIVGNSVSWGLYFLWYTQMKDLISHGDETLKLSASQHLLAASVSGCASAWLTNPIWVVKIRMFANVPPPKEAKVPTPPSSAPVYTGLYDGLRSIYRTEGLRGWYRGAGLSLLGVSNGAIQFTVYEQLKRWRSSVHIRRQGGNIEEISETGVKLRNTEYIFTSGASKMIAILATYPYQVVRSRVQNHSTDAQFPDALTTIRRTWANEGGIRAFYKGLTTTFIRVLPSTCVTFVVYEQIAWFLRDAAAKRATQPSSSQQNDVARTS